MAGLLLTVARAMEKYNFELVAVQGVRWDTVGSQPVGNYTLFYGNVNGNHHLGTGFFVRKEKRVEFISNRMLYISRVVAGE
jgi:hypothetical protein